MLKIKNLFLRYVSQYYALYDINLEIKQGEKVALVGDKNSGTTSLLRILSKQDKVTQGEVLIDDSPLQKISYADDIEMGYLPKKPLFLENKSVFHNFIYVLKLQNKSKNEIEKIINQTLIDFNIMHLKDTIACKLTLFQQFVVSIARVGLRKLDILLVENVLDELPKEEQEKIIELLKKVITQKTILLLATENEECAKPICNKILYFENGSLLKERVKK